MKISVDSIQTRVTVSNLLLKLQQQPQYSEKLGIKDISKYQIQGRQEQGGDYRCWSYDIHMDNQV